MKPKCGDAPDHDLLGKARQMHGGDRGGGEGLQHEIAVGHRVERVRHRPVEAERLRGHLAVDRKRGAGERRGAERGLVQPLARIGEAAAVARRHLDIGEQMMAEGHRLRGLQMREARHHRAGVLSACSASARWQRRARRRSRRSRRAPTAGNRSPPDRCASARCAAARRRPDQLGEPALDIHVDVFERALERELARLDLCQDRV